jgi:hypothetical protein
MLFEPKAFAGGMALPPLELYIIIPFFVLFLIINGTSLSFSILEVSNNRIKVLHSMQFLL